MSPSTKAQNYARRVWPWDHAPPTSTRTLAMIAAAYDAGQDAERTSRSWTWADVVFRVAALLALALILWRC